MFRWEQKKSVHFFNGHAVVRTNRYSVLSYRCFFDSSKLNVLLAYTGTNPRSLCVSSICCTTISIINPLASWLLLILGLPLRHVIVFRSIFVFPLPFSIFPILMFHDTIIAVMCRSLNHIETGTFLEAPFLTLCPGLGQVRIAELLGVAGTDVPIEEIEKLTPPFLVNKLNSLSQGSLSRRPSIKPIQNAIY